MTFAMQMKAARRLGSRKEAADKRRFDRLLLSQNTVHFFNCMWKNTYERSETVVPLNNIYKLYPYRKENNTSLL
jgi:hypothetical protein